jgi:4-amino-4-deoxy-L-arabinose transferase-like glycosyltransferase
VNAVRSFKKHVDVPLLVILLLALFLCGWAIWQAGSANSYYTAAVVSMTKSWHNFWYGAFDPAGFITVDKPPVALWLMAVSAKVFGVHGWSVVLPSVLAGVGSVYLLFKLVALPFGRRAGRIAALVMTLTPIAVADSRTNNMDTILICFLLLAAWLLVRSVRKRSPWLVMAAFGLVGVAFNVKMLQAFMLLPAMYLFYWLAARQRRTRKIVFLSLATVSLAFFTLLWPLLVDATPADQRPYIGSSQNNSVLSLAFGYNGSERLLGQQTGIGGAFPGMGMNGTQNRQGQMPADGGQPGGAGQQFPGGNQNRGIPGGQNRGMGGGAFAIGSVGPLRLLQSALGPQISWLLPFALVSLVGALTYYRDPRQRWWQTTRRQQHILFWAAWLIPIAAFFSIAAFFHPYYMIMLAPAIAALVGIGVRPLWRSFARRNWWRWKTYLLPTALLLTAGEQAYLVSTYSVWIAALIFIAVAAVVALLLAGQPFKRWAILGGALLMLLPAGWSLTPTLAAESAAIPTSGPSLLSGQGGRVSFGGTESQVNQKLLNYLLKHRHGAKYLLATTDANSASAYIIKTGLPVMAIGGYNGTDPAISLRQFKQAVKAGDIRYFYVSGRNNSSAIIKWVKKHGVQVSAANYRQAASSNSQSQAVRRQPSGGPNRNNQRPGGPGINNNRNGTPFAAAGGMGNQSGTLYRLSLK